MLRIVFRWRPGAARQLLVIRRTLPCRWCTTVECCTCTPSVWPASARCPARTTADVEFDARPSTAPLSRRRAETGSRADSAEAAGRSANASFSGRCTATTCSPALRAAPPVAPAAAAVVRPSSPAVSPTAAVPRTAPRPTSATAVGWSSAPGAVWRTTTTSRLSTRFSCAHSSDPSDAPKRLPQSAVFELSIKLLGF